MPRLTFPKFGMSGPVLGAQILAAGLPSTGASIYLQMLVDTGSDYTFVDEALLAGLNLKHVGAHMGSSIDNNQPRQKYEVSFQILDAAANSVFWDITPLVIRCRRTNAFFGLPFGGLIGRDVLDRGQFTYDGPSGDCSISF